MTRDSITKRFRELIEISKKLDTNKVELTYQQYKVVLTLEELQDFNQWKMSSLNLLDKTFSKESDLYKSFLQQLPSNIYLSQVIYLKNLTPYEYHARLSTLRGILSSALEEINSGFLYKIEHLISGDFFMSIMDEAEELVKKHHKDPAAVLLRVVIENTLKDLCDREGIVYVPKEKASSLNTKLKQAGVYAIPMERKIQANLDIGNFAAHGEFSKFSEKDVEDMLDFIKNHLVLI